MDFSTAKVVILASPGFVREDFRRFLFEEAARKGDKVREAVVLWASGARRPFGERLSQPYRWSVVTTCPGSAS